MATSQFLHGQLRAYSDSWQREHEQALACWELEARLKLAITLYDLIDSDEERRSQELRSASMRTVQAQEAYLREFHSLYSEWFKPCDEILHAIDRLESEGYRVEGAERFRETCKRVRDVLRVPTDRIIQSLKDLEQGKFKPLAEVRDELRRRAGA